VLAAAQAMARDGLVIGTSGNVSRRIDASDGRQLMAITASGVPYDRMGSGHIVIVDFEGEPVTGDLIPSTETLTHAAIYQARPDVGAVMHTHSIYASVLAVAGLEIPPMIDEAVLMLGGKVEVAAYGFPSSQELADHAVAALGERNAVLLRNHGLVGVGGSLEEALHICQMAEQQAHLFVLARMLGRARALPADVVASEIELFRMRRQAERE
jgi:L-fuculose-phosphate aldolase